MGEPFSLSKAIERYALADTAPARQDSFSTIKAQFVKHALSLTRGDILHLYKGALRSHDFSAVRAVGDFLSDYVSEHRSYDTAPVVRSIVGATGIMANALLRVDDQTPYPNWEGADEGWTCFVRKTQIALYSRLDDMIQDARQGCTPRSFVSVALDGYLYARGQRLAEDISDKTASALRNAAWLFPKETEGALDKRMKKVGPNMPESALLARATQLVDRVIL